MEIAVLVFCVLGAAIALLVLPSISRDAPARDHIAGALPIPVWLEHQGKVVWSNRAYDALSSPQTGTMLFPPGAERTCLPAEDGDHWFVPLRNGPVGLAIPADALIRAESDLRQVVQTMARAFAQLPIGLAVFDRQRHLQVFNPALCDLTDLSPEFLTRKPSLISMLDAMRNRNMVPEPKDWKDWRRQLVEMERGAASGHYDETWSLPGGQTYRVTGRPYPDGALALMVEDISSEILRSRRYRADLELCQAVIDTSDEGIAVFSASGQLVLSNSAYSALWGHDPGMTLSTQGIGQIANHWRGQSAPTPLWTEAEDFVTTIDSRDDWQAEARLVDGRLITCRFAALAGGSTLVGFRSRPARAKPRAVAGSA